MVTRNALKTLFHPFEAGELALPQAADRVLFLGAEPGFVLPDGWQSPLVPVQGFRPYFNGLVRSGYGPVAQIPQNSFQHTLVLCGRHRDRNQLWFAAALKHTDPGA